MLTRADYMMGRDERYPGSCTPEVEANCAVLLERVNRFLAAAAAEGIEPGVDERTGTAVASGLRPLAVNDRTQNAAAMSAHITGEGIDLQDVTLAQIETLRRLHGQGAFRWPVEEDEAHHRALARFALRCARPGGFLEVLGLYMERPQWTPDWVHLQTRAPRSGRRVYVPSSKPPLAAALPEEDEFVV